MPMTCAFLTDLRSIDFIEFVPGLSGRLHACAKTTEPPRGALLDDGSRLERITLVAHQCLRIDDAKVTPTTKVATIPALIAYFRGPRRRSKAFARVRIGSLADTPTSPRRVRFTPNNGRWAGHPNHHSAPCRMSLPSLQRRSPVFCAAISPHRLVARPSMNLVSTCCFPVQRRIIPAWKPMSCD